MPRVLEFLEAHAPDVLFLQETKSTRTRSRPTSWRRPATTPSHHSAGRWAGVAIARADGRDPDAAPAWPARPAADEARWLEATVDGVRIAAVYVPNGRAVGTADLRAEAAGSSTRWPRASPRCGARRRHRRRLQRLPAPTSTSTTRWRSSGDTHVTGGALALRRDARGGGSSTPTGRSTPTRSASRGGTTAPGHFHKRMGLRIDSCS